VQTNSYHSDMRGSPADVCFAFERELIVPSVARRALAELLHGSDDVMVNRVLLAVSEVVTNAVVHTSSGGVMRVWARGPDGRLRVEVEDYSPVLPVVGGDGRGLVVVERSADAWGVERTATGKVVWAEFNRPTSQAHLLPG
jgi:anti-sigma regulatory factor (Ser/Thr protein kinase)